jgi:hypothetical protein
MISTVSLAMKKQSKKVKMMSDITITLNMDGVVEVSAKVSGAQDQIDTARFIEKLSPAIDVLNRAAQESDVPRATES